jgi:hypothetical protein
MKIQLRLSLFALLFLCAWVPSVPSANTTQSRSCPVIAIRCSSVKSCCGSKYTLAVDIAGGYLDRKPTYTWSVSAGKIIKGQGTDSIEVDASCAGNKPITVTVEIGNIIPAGCPTKSSFTRECDKS